MDSLDLQSIIDKIQEIKQSQKKKYKSELIDGIQIINNQNDHVCIDDGEIGRSWQYERLIKEQRKLVYKKDLAKQQIASDRSQLNPETKATTSSFKPVSDQTVDINDLKKTWNKLTNNMKIHAVIKFIESLSHNLCDSKVNQLRYLLISSISQKKLNRPSDVEYNSEKGLLERINILTFEDGVFKLSEGLDPNRAIGLNTFQTLNECQSVQPIKKKIILIKK